MVSKFAILVFLFFGESLVAKTAIEPFNQWICKQHCGEIPGDNDSLNNEIKQLKNLSVQVYASKRIKGGSHVVDRCGEGSGYEECYLIPKTKSAPLGFILAPEASGFKVNSTRSH